MPADRTPADRRAAEIIQTWLDGATPDAAGALTHDPELAADKAIALDLAFAEFLIREHKGERLDVEEYCARFPAYHASLGRMLAQQSVGPAAGGLDAVIPGGPSRRGLDTPVISVEGFLPRPPERTSTPTPTPTPTGSGSSPSRRSGQVAWPEPGGRVGDFNLLRQLGKGAFGRVFLALEEPTTRHVVVKVSKQKCDEAKVLGRLGHRNVVSVLSAPHDLASGLYLVVMPYHGSATLEDLLELAYPLSKAKADRPRGAEVILTAARRNLQPRDPAPSDARPDAFLLRAGFVDGVVWLGVRVAEALAAVHACGFVHHDLKPSNVLLGLDGQPRLLDFNLASDARNTKSRLGGTLPYMPPEHLQAVKDPQAAGNMDVRGDVYSLGVILYELLTGTHPFGRFPKSRSARTVAEEMLARQKLGVRPLRERNPDVSHRLARLVEKCLSFDPAGRPQTAAAVAAELKQCYSARKRALQFLGTRPGRVAVTTAAVGVVSVVSWMVSAQARATPDYRRQGMAALSQGRYAEAAPNLAYATQMTPHDADLWLALGRSRLGQGEWQAARSALEKAAELRPGHGPTEATLGWCLAKLGHHEAARAALAHAETAGYTPAGLYVVRGFTHFQVRQDRDAERAFARALEIDPGNRAALVNRAQLAYMQALGRSELPPAWAFEDVEKAVRGTPDAYVYHWAAEFYAWAARKPAHVKGNWHPEMAAMKERCRENLRKAVEAGLPDAYWTQSSNFRFLFGEPDVYAKDWVRPSQEADPWAYWRMGDPLVEFAG
ncbi:MAG TPA: protein kinase [Gemmataceae bacterium]|nr:protein kinase [Gemmataceae bacterium]